MCLGIPGQVIRMLDGYEGQLALVDVTGEARKVNVGMLPEETFADRRLGDHPHGLRRREDRPSRGRAGDGRSGADGARPQRPASQPRGRLR